MFRNNYLSVKAYDEDGFRAVCSTIKDVETFLPSHGFEFYALASAVVINHATRGVIDDDAGTR